MPGEKKIGLQALIFSLVAAAFSTIYVTQPVLPVLREEFGVSASTASLTISAVIMGISLANLPFGMLVDRYPIRPIILLGGSVIAACGLFCAVAADLRLLIAARFVQGLFVPSLTTCLVVHLVRSLPAERLNVVAGSYVSATVVGGLGGRLLGGWIHPPLHWRYAFVTASALLLAATLAAAFRLPKDEGRREAQQEAAGFAALLRRPDLLRVYFVAFGSFFVFSSVFNYLPFYLAAPPFRASTQVITLAYLSYLVGAFTGPAAGRLSNRIGNGATMALGSATFAVAIAATFIPSLPVIAASLAGVCAGFFAIHSAAAGSLNLRLSTGRGRANSLYVLFYYIGGSIGITASGIAFHLAGWHGVGALGILVLALPFATGVFEMRREQHPRGNIVD
ncbi:MAG: MFS transporter [Deltaproteobacteria bacterium]|nr:MFS transporter [Deltaproteobacteria bacterium]PWB61271.1 MAG: MFS transporter [Deltaproteobacteria bacterium]